MPFIVKTRYGAEAQYSGEDNFPAIVESLIHELETDHFDEPDNEHTQVATRNGQWSVTVQVSGLMTLDDLSWDTGSEEDVPSQERFIRANSRDEVVEMLRMVAQGDIEKVLSKRWVPFDEIPPYRRDLFRAS